MSGAVAIDKIAAARVWLLREKPFFGVLARALRVEEGGGAATLRLLPDDRLLVAPAGALALPFPALCARVAHVALHAALGAFARRGGREPLRWNAAHDAAIAPLLGAAGMGAASGEATAGESAEEVYARLDEGARPEEAWCDLADPPLPPGAVGAYRRELGEEGEPSAKEAQERALAWRVRLLAALAEERASGGKTFGERPAWIDAWVRATVEPPPSFCASLQRSIAQLTRAERSYLRPSRRMSALAGEGSAWPELVSMPGRRTRQAGRLVCVIDTSASIDEPTLGRFLGAVAAAATAEGIDEVRRIQADAAITRDELITAAELTLGAVAIVGRGGSDFRPALRALSAEARREGEAFTAVYLTDLEGTMPAPEDAVGVSVLWVVPGPARSTPAVGRVLTMPRS